MTKYYPMMINIKNKKCLVVGGGNVAFRKVNELIEYGAKVTLVSKEINENINSLVENVDKSIIYIEDTYKREYIKGAFIVIAATNDRGINFEIASDCEQKDILVNVVDDLESSRFIVPAKVKRGDLTITVSTNGKCPFYSKLLRKKLDLQFDNSYSIFVNILGDFRKELLKNIESCSKRKDIMASLDMEYYIKKLREMGEEEVRKEIMAHAL
ncbi:bifunctional precorrin-2 dehydrogenase/sirohydrochlorin ferrochelatase [Clostridium tagluense]|uniref:precorrin-2 dehydrogenase/sirohydrochlorin ferrochelatase family protein n=1 Tax=Clostridium tagluense TaxID=360422 RepID=UPI001C6DE061|nr:bifunctional precorrin-2 dehydrogenase/sirohydrochlorin ferrochelatase [Clostridium tagluense]MBW9157339.1 bifunctional precorrin-2 dehydrogenase/sirohydrochlorin ferrochelatase [Clostridium tagluense]MCB2310855.1 bifunctional precorrin-2 dehydrogenase/sirohydrochlorin ferrochelatase [Clostridium tagluense]MCB2315709.1 bifunctional precorrin-2 dehydrogenase/sirohydrochlorin ferrochelatase [Clostridium tagluense]MCB2320647.1 bifunctional precorrin-2 dehydrogenase/sirohydrochlorin ferrochelata